MKTAGIIRIVIGTAAALLLTALLVVNLSGTGNRWLVKPVYHLNGSSGDFDEDWESDWDDGKQSGANLQEAAPEENGAGKAESGKTESGKGETGKQATASASGDGSGVQNRTAVGGGSVDAASLRKIEITWVAGEVRLVAGTGTSVEFSESSAEALTDAEKLRYAVRDGKLVISYCEETIKVWKWLELDRLNMPSKDLVVTLPADLSNFSEIEVDTVSASVYAKDLAVRELSIETTSGGIGASNIAGEELSATTVSGRIELVAVAVNKLDLETVSGEITATGTANKVETDAVSGGASLIFTNVPDEIDAETVSGDVDVTLPKDATDFTARLDSVSGDLNCGFPSVTKNGRCIVGVGTKSYQFETVSGDIALLPAS